MARGFIFFVFALFALVLSVMARGESGKESEKERGMRNWPLIVREANEMSKTSSKRFETIPGFFERRKNERRARARLLKKETSQTI